MQLIVSGRGGGKTHQLIQWYKENPEQHRIVTRNQRMAKYLQENYDVDKKHIYTFERVRTDSRGETNIILGLDIDLELLIYNALGIDGYHTQLGPVTVNGEIIYNKALRYNPYVRERI